MLVSLRESMIVPHPIFMHVHSTPWYIDLSMTVHLLTELCFCLGISMLRVCMGDVDTRDITRRPVHAPFLLTCASTLIQPCSLTLSGCSVQVNRVLTYHDLDNDLMKFAAFQILVSGFCYGLASVNPSSSRLMSSATVILRCTKYTALWSRELAVSL